MAKRERSYVGTKAYHRSEARIFTVQIRRLAREIREDLKRGDCNQAVQDLGVLNRAVGSARVHRVGIRSPSLTPWKLATRLEAQVYRKCVLKRKDYRLPR